MKYLSLILVVIITLGGLTGCNNKNKQYGELTNEEAKEIARDFYLRDYNDGIKYDTYDNYIEDGGETIHIRGLATCSPLYDIGYLQTNICPYIFDSQGVSKDTNEGDEENRISVTFTIDKANKDKVNQFEIIEKTKYLMYKYLSQYGYGDTPIDVNISFKSEAELEENEQ